MNIDTVALSVQVRKIAVERFREGSFSRGFLETAADGLVQLEADNKRLSDENKRLRSAMSLILPALSNATTVVRAWVGANDGGDNA